DGSVAALPDVGFVAGVDAGDGDAVSSRDAGPVALPRTFAEDGLHLFERHAVADLVEIRFGQLALARRQEQVPKRTKTMPCNRLAMSHLREEECSSAPYNPRHGRLLPVRQLAEEGDFLGVERYP